METKQEQRLVLKTSLKGEGYEEQVEESRMNLEEKARQELARLSTSMPCYQELNEEGKRKVDKYISQIDLSNPESIMVFGEEEMKAISERTAGFIGTISTHRENTNEMIINLMMELEEDGEQEEKFLDMLRKSPLQAIKKLRNKPKEMAKREKYKRATALTNLDTMSSKLEGIRVELKMNVEKLRSISQNFLNTSVEVKYQIIALQEALKSIEAEEMAAGKTTEISETDLVQSVSNEGLINSIKDKIKNFEGLYLSAVTRAIMAQYMARSNFNLANKYESSLTTSIPLLTDAIIMDEANEALLEAANIHAQFRSGVNKILVRESERSKQAIEQVEQISKQSVIDLDTAKVLTSNIISVVRNLKEMRKDADPEIDAFMGILSDFRRQLNREINTDLISLESGNIGSKTDTPEEQAER